MRAAGRVVALDRRQSGSTASYHAIVEFESGGRTVRFTDRQGSNPPGLQAGDPVMVLYADTQPAGTPMVDRGPWNWAWPLATCAGGALLVVLGGRRARGRASDP